MFDGQMAENYFVVQNHRYRGNLIESDDTDNTDTTEVSDINDPVGSLAVVTKTPAGKVYKVKADVHLDQTSAEADVTNVNSLTALTIDAVYTDFYATLDSMTMSEKRGDRANTQLRLAEQTESRTTGYPNYHTGYNNSHVQTNGATRLVETADVTNPIGAVIASETDANAKTADTAKTVETTGGTPTETLGSWRSPIRFGPKKTDELNDENVNTIEPHPEPHPESHLEPHLESHLKPNSISPPKFGTKSHPGSLPTSFSDYASTSSQLYSYPYSHLLPRQLHQLPLPPATLEQIEPNGPRSDHDVPSGSASKNERRRGKIQTFRNQAKWIRRKVKTTKQKIQNVPNFIRKIYIQNIEKYRYQKQ
ncbi:hypothetical protein [Apis mellifera filamentous virus]|uniref:hypothetical protein n=1 Tax=Apis mellifera filamentous virus TaxID=1100043 RepID=UPI0006BD9FB3|nr:hypothetical protein APL35_gp105 [Apis mellifera filamentous virus]AKY03174.1 hypothetical protein [Apis mellifera filamentous virus]